MFKEIQQLMDDGVSFMTVTIAPENDALRVNFIPKASCKDDLTATPLSLLGTAAELVQAIMASGIDFKGLLPSMLRY